MDYLDIAPNDSRLILDRPKIFMRGDKVHFQGIAGYSDQLVIDYVYLLNALQIMHKEQLVMWWEKNGSKVPVVTETPKRSLLTRFSDWLFRRK